MNVDLKFAVNILNQIDKIQDYLKNDSVQNNRMQLLQTIIDSVHEVCVFLYGIKDGQFERELVSCDDIDEEIRIIHEWRQKAEQTIEYLSKFFRKIDYDFYKLMLYVEHASEDQMLDNAMKCLVEHLSMESEETRKIVLHNWNYCSYFWGAFDPNNGVYDHLLDAIHELKKNKDRIIAIFDKFSDYRSKHVFYSIIHFWLYFDHTMLESALENSFNDYYDHDLLQGMTQDEVVVDCGAFVGDSAVSYFDNFGSCKKMYLYDMVPSNLKKAHQNLDAYENIVFRNAGVTDSASEGKIVNIVDKSTAMMSLIDEDVVEISENGPLDKLVPVPLVMLDHDIEEPVTFIKMDIEGSEVEALKGAEEHIKKEHPILAICAYHRYSHIREIAELVLSYNPDYQLYLRYNGHDSNSYVITEYVLFAIPKERMI